MNQRYALYDDLHTEMDDPKNKNPEKIWTPPVIEEREVLLFAGDIVTNPKRLRAFAERVEKEQPHIEAAIYIAGNHEFWSDQVKLGASGYDDYREAIADLPRSVFLEKETYRLSDGVTVAGTTLWTDLSSPASEAYARRVMNDYQNIRIDKDGYRKLQPHDTTKIHQQSVAFLKEVMSNEDPGKTLVMTHHSPTQHGLTLRGNDMLELDLYGARLENLISMWQPKIWVHGHTHESIDRIIGQTRIVNNPRGYNIENHLNPKFNPEFGLSMVNERIQQNTR